MDHIWKREAFSYAFCQDSFLLKISGMLGGIGVVFQFMPWYSILRIFTFIFMPVLKQNTHMGYVLKFYVLKIYH